MPAPLLRLSSPLTRLLALVVLAAVVTVGGLLVPPARPASADTFGAAAVRLAAAQAGKPYAWGAAGPGAFDCSGLTSYVFGHFGVPLPHNTTAQYGVTQHLAQWDKQPGDLVFFNDGSWLGHVGLYAGNNQVWHAPHAGDVVRLTTIWTPDYVVSRVPLYSAILQHYFGLGGADSFLGDVTSPEYPVPGGRAQNFAGGIVYWSPWTGAHEVHGAILGDYLAIGGAWSPLGLPVNDESAAPGGRTSAFAGGSIYWSWATGAHEVHGAIKDYYNRLGGASGLLGLPTSDEQFSPGGRVSSFAGGSVYWSPASWAHEVHGAIRWEYQAIGGSGSPLGFPISDETAAGSAGGRMSAFSGGSVYWSSATSAHEVHGDIFRAYQSRGGVGGPLAFPTSDEHPAAGGRQSDFQQGTIYWHAFDRRTVVNGR